MNKDLLAALRSESSVFGAELRPPRAELAAGEGMDAWIDTYHAVRRLTRQGTFVFLTDSAVGEREEDNLRHLVINLGTDVPRERIVPFLTSKHSIDYCLSYAERAHQSGFPALVVLGGDKSVGDAALPRACVAASAAAARARPHAGARRMGESERRSRAASRLSGVADVPRRVLPDADRQPSQRRAGRAVHRQRGAPQARPAGRVRRLLLPERERAHARTR